MFAADERDRVIATFREWLASTAPPGSEPPTSKVRVRCLASFDALNPTALYSQLLMPAGLTMRALVAAACVPC